MKSQGFGARTPALRLVPRAEHAIDADMVAFRVMEDIDKTYPELWCHLPVSARASVRNIVVRAAMAEDAKR